MNLYNTTLIVLFILGTQLLTGQIDNLVIGVQAAPGITTGDQNTVVGDSAAHNLRTSSRSVMFGFAAGFNSSTSSSDNIFLGFRTGFSSLMGSDNVYMGYLAGSLTNSTTLRQDNILLGSRAGAFNTTGISNVFIGEEAGLFSSTGSNNVFIGEDAAYYNSSGSDNIAIGESAAYGSVNNRATGIGNVSLGGFSDFRAYSSFSDVFFSEGPGSAGGGLTSGSLNTYVGASAGADSDIGNANTFIGVAAGSYNEDIGESTFVGTGAGNQNDRLETGISLRNNAFGFEALDFNREGSDNIGFGSLVGLLTAGSSTTALRNVLFGNNVLVRTGFNDNVLFGRGIETRGVQITALGAAININARNGIGIGFNADIAAAADSALAIGAQANVDGLYAIALGANTVASASNSVALGYQASSSIANSVQIGNTAITSIGGAVNWTATSDGRFKQNIQEDVVGLQFINGLRPLTYQYKATQLHQDRGFETERLKTALKKKNQIRYSGFLAQEVESLANTLAYDFSGIDAPKDKNGLYGLRYATFVVPLVKALQELNTEIKASNKEIAALKEQHKKMEALLEKMERLEEELQALETKKSITQN